MDYTLQKRIVGAIILIVAAIVFVPMLLDGPGKAGTQTVDLGIPEPGADGMRTEVVPLDAPLPPPRVPNEFEVMPDPAGESAVAVTEPPVTEMPDSLEGIADPGVPTAPAATSLPETEAPSSADAEYAADSSGRWHVTLGSYANVANAQKLVADMRRAGLPARAETVTLAGKPAQRVRIGPYADRVRAEAARLAVAARRKDVTPALVQDNSAAVMETSAAQAPAAPINAPAANAPTANTPTANTPTANTPTANTPTANTPTVAAPVAPNNAIAPAPSSEPLPRDVRGWVVQTGAFAQVDEANEQVTKFRTAGFAAFVDRLDAPGGTLHRVRIGPEAQRSGADQLQASLKQSLGVSGVVMRHP